MTGWWYTYPSEKYESQLGWFFPRYGKIKNDPNHQPEPDDAWGSSILELFPTKWASPVIHQQPIKAQFAEWL